MNDLEKQYQKAYEDYLEARDHLWKVRDRMIKKEASLKNLKQAKVLIKNLLKILAS